MEECELSKVATEPKRLHIGLLEVEIHPTRDAAGAAAAQAAAEAMRNLARSRESFSVIFATGASQISTLAALTSMQDLPWEQVEGFHMDEYIGLSPDRPASFRRYMREKLSSRVPMKQFHEIDGNAPDPERTAAEYAQKLRSAGPQLCLLGVGENGHLAFNDPPVADFADPLDAKVVELDTMCRGQQVAEGWFAGIEDVPQSAITLTIPALMRVPRLIASVPGIRKAAIVRRVLHDPVSTECPATILRTRPGVTIFLDADSASELDEVNGNG
jgi:glucosamine-6-phosphate deaminase